MRTSAPFGAKNFQDFSKVMVIRTDKGVEQVRTRWVNFSRFCADVLYGRLLNIVVSWCYGIGCKILMEYCLAVNNGVLNYTALQYRYVLMPSFRIDS